MSAPTLVALALALAATVWALVLLGRLREPKESGERQGTVRGDGGGEGPSPLAGDGRELRRILNGVPDAFFHLDSSWRVTFLNEGAVEMLEGLEVEADDVLDETLWDVFPTPPDDAGRRTLERAMSEGSTESWEARFEPLDAWLEIRAFPSSGGVAVHVGDVSERREAERTLRETEERFRAVVENAPEAILVMDAEREEVLDFNENARMLFGRSGEEIESSMPFQFSPEYQPDGRRSVEAARETIRRTLEGETPTLEWVHLTGDGERIHTEVRLARVPSSDRELVQAIIRDITDRKRAEEALRESEERYRTLFEKDVSGNFVTSVDGRIVACNRSFADMFGFPSVEAAVGTDLDRLHPSADERRRLMEEIRKQGAVDYFEIEGRKTDGTPMHLVENVRAVYDEEGRLTELRGHVVDVTERRLLEEQLQQAQRLEAVGRLAGGIAHDFNNLLTTVTGHTDLLLTDDRIPPDLRDDLRRIKRATRHAARLTSQLVAFSRKQVLQSVNLDLNHVVEEVVEILERTIGEDVRLELDLASDLRTVDADPGQVEQVLMNLALNARDAMPRGGSLEIVTRNADFGEDDDRPGEVDPGRYAVLEVRDSGKGMSEEQMGKIFDPFYTTKGPGEGSGLGLAMVYGIVRQSDGHVLVDSVKDEGSTFTVLLPADRESSDASSDARPRGEISVDGGRSSILLVQHDPVVRKLVRRILHREGHSVLEADDPDEAVAFCREWQGPIDGVVSDLLSTEDERRLRAALAEHRPGTRILWTRDSATDTAPGVDPGDGVLVKPFSSQELSRQVRQLLADSGERGAKNVG